MAGCSSTGAPRGGYDEGQFVTDRRVDQGGGDRLVGDRELDPGPE
jgi:hypothetical protein